MSKSHYIIPIFVPHEGCPHDCVFCNQNSITGTKNKVDSAFVERTIEEYLKTIKRQDAIVEVSFFGGTFTAIDINKQRELLSVAKEYKDKGLIDYIHLSTRPDYIDNVILDNLKLYSVDIIELGVQSLDDEVLLKSGRGHTSSDVKKASDLILEYGFTLGHQVMLGLPGDNIKKDIYTAKKVVEMNPSIARIYPALVVKDTAMEKMFKEGTYKPYTLEEAVDISKIVYGIFTSNNINVIRIGLQPTDEINYGKDLIEGPFHPSFRELVESSIYNDIILENIKEFNSEECEIHVNSRDISKLYAYKKKFFNYMKNHINTKKIVVFQDDTVDRGSILLKDSSNVKKIIVKNYLEKNFKEGYFKYL